MIHRLRRKFILIAILSVTLVMAIMAVSINVLNFLSTDRDLQRTLELIYNNRGTVPQFQGGRRPEAPSSPTPPFSPETPFSTRYFVLRYGSDGTLAEADMRHIAAVTEADADTYLDIALAHGPGSGYTGIYKFYVVQTESGEYMAIFLDCLQELRTLRTFALASLGVALSCAVLVSLLVIFFSRRAIDPVVKSVEKQKQFITDASHELKTPLTVITTSLKVLEMEVGQQKWIDKARAQTSKLTELVGELVTLSRLDEERPPVQPQVFDVSAAVEEVAQSFADFAAARGHALDLSIPPGLSLRGDEHLIRQLVSILLDNGVKYAAGTGPISLSLAEGRRGVVLRTWNDCAGLAPEELERLFDRFYRVDKARTKQEQGGFGVGLSIARSIVEAHRGTIRAAFPRPGVIQFTAVLRGI